MKTRTSILAVVAGVFLLGCAPDAADLPLHPDLQFAAAPHARSGWSEPVYLDEINDPDARDQGPALSKDGLSLYFASDRPGSVGDLDLWVARRACLSCPWQQPQNLAGLNTPGNDNVPALSRDGHWLFFNSNRPGGYGAGDIWASYREDVHDDFAWEPPVNLGPLVNSTAGEFGPAYFENDGGAPQLFLTRDVQMHASELLPDGTWSAIVPVPGFTNDHPEFDTNNVARPTIAPNGTEMFFFSNSRIWYATRVELAADAPWEVARDPVFRVPGQAGGFSNHFPHIHWHGPTETLLLTGFPATGPGGANRAAIYMSTRTRGAEPVSGRPNR